MLWEGEGSGSALSCSCGLEGIQARRARARWASFFGERVSWEPLMESIIRLIKEALHQVALHLYHSLRTTTKIWDGIDRDLELTLHILVRVLGKLGPGQSGPGQLGPGQLGPGQLGPGARLSVANWAPDSWAPGPGCPGPNCPP